MTESYWDWLTCVARGGSTEELRRCVLERPGRRDADPGAVLVVLGILYLLQGTAPRAVAATVVQPKFISWTALAFMTTASVASLRAATAST